MQIERFFSNMWIYNLSACEILVQVCEYCTEEGTALQVATVFGHRCKCCKIFGD